MGYYSDKLPCNNFSTAFKMFQWCLLHYGYLFVPQFTSPGTTLSWTFDGERKNFPFCCFVRELREDILKEITGNIKKAKTVKMINLQGGKRNVLSNTRWTHGHYKYYYSI